MPYRAIFYGWNNLSEYRAPVPPNFQRTELEDRLAKLYELDDEQLSWRRVKKAELKELFEQEYPINDSEAFIASASRSYFNPKYLRSLIDDLPKPVEIVRPGEGQLRGMLEIYKQPEEGHRYVIGGDVALGLSDGDWSTLDVADVETWEHVASYWAHVRPEVLGVEAVVIGGWFNDALIGVENNNHGILTNHVIVREQLYPNVYYHEVKGKTEDGKPTVRQEWGFDTTEKSKTLLDDDLSRAINEVAEGRDGLKLNGRRAIEELIRYIEDEGGQRHAETGHDDHVTSIREMYHLLKRVGGDTPKSKPPAPAPVKLAFREERR